MGNVFAMMNRRVVRSAPNPLDKATIVSIFPREIYETKHTTQPSVYHLYPGTFDNPSVLVVEPFMVERNRPTTTSTGDYEFFDSSC